jgi:serine phosphatase RsbU (regulator of sigma subunit)
MFTDGLVETRKGNGPFDTERTAAVLERCADQPADAIAEELVASVKRFHGNELVDDLALLLLRASEATQVGHEVET